MPVSDNTWCLYLIECSDGSYYAGITNHLDARYAAHVAGRGARYTRSHPPLRLIGARPYADRAAASRAEWEIKRLPKQRKIAYLMQGHAANAEQAPPATIEKTSRRRKS
ncbi:GIY-YIG nuclease family protein [Dyella silvatica]|uniref:GIY-YIG nuclease family protein n=1 Tax=Dyella silvatica TaxID=2992128 RepID=UPI00225310F3|nr:GIY-YIG nuclease family protein [Dyella silvatica]